MWGLIVLAILMLIGWFSVYKLRKRMTFEAHKVPFLFTLCGGHISPILVAADKRHIRVIDVRHEASAVFAADAVSRLSQSVGVAVVTAGPGLTNTVTAVKNAQMAESPVILLAGAAAGLLRGRGSLQDVDQLTLFRPLCKWTTRINQVKEIVPKLSRAFYEARSGTPGPVLVEFPIDTLYPYHLVRQHCRISENPQSWGQRITNLYLRFYLFRLFANGFLIKPCPPEVEPTKIPIWPPLYDVPKPHQIEKLATLLAQAQRPVVVLGSQAMLPPVEAKSTAEHVKLLRVPVYLTGMGRGLLGRQHPCAFRHARSTALREADLIVLAGAVCDFRLDYGRVLNRKAKIVIINRNKKQLYLNSDLFWRPHLAIRADVGTTLQEVATRISERYPCSADFRCPVEWTQEMQAREVHRDEEIQQSTTIPPTSDRANPLAVLWNLEQHGLPANDEQEESIIVADGGDFVGSAAYILRPRGPLSWIDPGPFGTLGVGGGFALGAKLCRPNATVWVVYGDGSAAYSLAEWDTMSRHSLPAIAVIGNDACWSQIVRDQEKLFKSSVACGLKTLRYDVIGAAYAGKEMAISDYDSGDVRSAAQAGAFVVNRSNFHSVVQVLREARSVASRGEPVVINCLIANSSFRDQSTSV